jgi:hypothetical protein
MTLGEDHNRGLSLPDHSSQTANDPVYFSNIDICSECNTEFEEHDLIKAYKCLKAKELIKH